MEKEFIEGKWYKGRPDSCYIKFHHIEKCKGYNKIWYNERVGEKLKYMDYWASNDLEKYALSHPVTQKELIKLLPKGHPDLNQEPQYEIY